MKYFKCTDPNVPNPFYRDTGKRIEYRCEHSKIWQTSFGSREGMQTMVADGFMVEVDAPAAQTPAPTTGRRLLLGAHQRRPARRRMGSSSFASISGAKTVENDMKIRIDGGPWHSIEDYRLPQGGYALPAYGEVIELRGTLVADRPMILNNPAIFGDLEYQFQPCRPTRKPRQSPPFWSAYKK